MQELRCRSPQRGRESEEWETRLFHADGNVVVDLESCLPRSNSSSTHDALRRRASGTEVEGRSGISHISLDGGVAVPKGNLNGQFVEPPCSPAKAALPLPVSVNHFSSGILRAGQGCACKSPPRKSAICLRSGTRQAQGCPARGWLAVAAGNWQL